MIAIDTNLLVYVHRAGVPEHAPARVALEAARNAPGGWGVSWPVVAELWSVLSGSAVGPKAVALHVVEAMIADITRAGGAIWMPSAGMANRLASHANRMGVRGTRIFDLQIACIAREHGARELWTHDAGFLTVPGLPVRDPL
ncbi:MAG: type II toxin-antitoxin system VapC family toxin [Terriglobales bacterium]